MRDERRESRFMRNNDGACMHMNINSHRVRAVGRRKSVGLCEGVGIRV